MQEHVLYTVLYMHWITAGYYYKLLIGFVTIIDYYLYLFVQYVLYVI